MSDAYGDAVAELARAVSHLYYTFSKARLPRARRAQLWPHDTPTSARDWSLDKVCDEAFTGFFYDDKSLQTELLRFFLPRICHGWCAYADEESADVKNDSGESDGGFEKARTTFPLDFIAARLKQASWYKWSCNDCDAIRNWLLAWWSVCLALPLRSEGPWTQFRLPEARSACNCLWLLGMLDTCMREALECWNTASDVAAVRQLVCLIDKEWENVVSTGKLDRSATYDVTAYRDLVQWLGSTTPTMIIERLLPTGSENYDVNLTLALTRHSWMRAALIRHGHILDST